MTFTSTTTQSADWSRSSSMSVSLEIAGSTVRLRTISGSTRLPFAVYSSAKSSCPAFWYIASTYGWL